MIQTSWGSEVKIMVFRQIAHVGQMRNAYRILVCKPHGKSSGILEDNIKTNLKEIGHEDGR
jgi:hypothetical protein